MQLKNEHGRKMRSDEILTLFGLPPNSPIPPTYGDKKCIQGIMVYIFPRGQAPYNIKRRVVAECPACRKLVCAGHLDQHYKVHKK